MDKGLHVNVKKCAFTVQEFDLILTGVSGDISVISGL